MFPDNNKVVIDNFIEYNFGEFEECTAEDLKDNEDFKETAIVRKLSDNYDYLQFAIINQNLSKDSAITA